MIRKVKPQTREKVIFWLYRIMGGVKEIYNKLNKELIGILYPKLVPREYNLFTMSNHK